MLAMAGALELQATSVDRSVLDTLDYVREITALTRDHIPGRVPARDDDGRLLTDAGGKPVMRELDVSFASEDWRRAIRDRQRPGMFVRRHLKACVLTYLAEELRTGDVAVARAQAYANWAGHLLSPVQCLARPAQQAQGSRRPCSEADQLPRHRPAADRHRPGPRSPHRHHHQRRPDQDPRSPASTPTE